jgi:hypothetical protein
MEAGFFYSYLQISPVVIKIALTFSAEGTMEAPQSHLDQILDAIASLSLDEEEMLLKIIKQRHIERRREQILRDSRETMRAYKKGLAKTGTVEDLMQDLESD